MKSENYISNAKHSAFDFAKYFIDAFTILDNAINNNQLQKLFLQLVQVNANGTSGYLLSVEVGFFVCFDGLDKRSQHLLSALLYCGLLSTAFIPSLNE